MEVDDNELREIYWLIERAYRHILEWEWEDVVDILFELKERMMKIIMGDE